MARPASPVPTTTRHNSLVAPRGRTAGLPGPSASDTPLDLASIAHCSFRQVKGDGLDMRVRIWASDNELTPTAARPGSRGWPVRLTALSAAALTAAAVAGCASSSAGTSDPAAGSSSSGGSASGSAYTIHAIVGETGSASFLGTEEAAAFNALAKHVNATGGIDRHPP